ncbi:unnamed protein product [Effrenium voratum]|nr:unnamed protein product [Effrenium voratum]CAJ1355421.1 unnamed protein product [Effrenium voratum]
MLNEHRLANYIARSADVIRRLVKPALSHHHNQIDRHTRLLLDDSGPTLVNACVLAQDLWARRVGNLWYSHLFAERIFHEMLLNHAKVKTAWPRLMLDSARAGNVLTNLLPTHTASWWPLVEDIFRSTECLSLMSRLLRMAVRHDEYKYLSVDGTFRVCLSLLGQAGFNEPAAVRQQYPFKDDTSFRRIITMRGRTGAEEVSSCIQKALPDQALEQVKCVATDNPSSKLVNALAQRLPNLSCVVLDATHASMHYEEATGGRLEYAAALHGEVLWQRFFMAS